jgi:hypothetical protein
MQVRLLNLSKKPKLRNTRVAKQLLSKAIPFNHH